jgi:hypothetical protein
VDVLRRCQNHFKTIEKGSKISSMDKHSLFNRPTLQLHRRQRFWQILFPMVLVVILMLITGGFTIAAGQAENRLWADISIVWMVAPLLILALFLLAILVGMIYLLARLSSHIPKQTRRVQILFRRIGKESQKIADSAVRPVLWLHQFQGGIKSVFEKLKPAK